MASLAPAKAEVGAVAKADQYQLHNITLHYTIVENVSLRNPFI